MTTGYICDRCGETFTDGGRWLQGVYNGSTAIMHRWDLCPDCMDGLEGWMDGGQESQDVTCDIERVAETPELLHDTREKLEADVADMAGAEPLYATIIGWLDRQAAITERETKLRELYRFEENHREHVRSIEAVNQELNAKLADAREALDAAWGEREELKAANDRLLVALDAIEGCDNRCKQIGTERDRWKDAFEDSERMRLALVDDLGKRDMGIERLKRRRGELMEQVRSLQDELARVRRMG